MPPDQMINQTEFQAELRNKCPGIIIKAGDPIDSDIRSDKLPKLVILGNTTSGILTVDVEAIIIGNNKETFFQTT